MRAILLVLVLSSLAWLAFHSFRSVKAGSSETAEPAGILMAGAPAPAAPATVVPSTPVPAPAPPAATRLQNSAPKAPAAESKATPAARPAPSPASNTAPPPPAVQASARPPSTPAPERAADEVAAASVLLHRTRELPAYLDGPGRGLSKGRRELALALHKMLLGPIEEGRRMAEDLDAADGVLVSEAAFVKQGLAAGTALAAAPARGESPLLLAATLARIATEAEAALAAGKHREAALAYGQLIQGEIQAPWHAERESLVAWSDALARAESGYRWNPSGNWTSVDVKVESGDSLISVRKRAIQEHPELLICTGQIERANGLHGGTIHPGQTLRLPASRASVLVDLDAHWALYRLGAEIVCAWEIGVGKPGSETPTGEYVVGEKTKEPPWFRPGHAPVPYGDPENPLGSRWIAWMNPEGGATSLGFHGTKDPESIGEDQSLGCVRMRQAAIEELFEILPKGAPVSVQP